ncbi:MAG: beta-galactosidase trimerization domain-containing protein [Candidatus Omnitrophica bacterium]|nr:beta-galactosidase trimerization domain-containing protein [Candidatus Omnitrophota bacterium]MCM8803235.1 beta-galactosidase trimerization domain-containing protein [Candidatus Omnitrophota bacterium]
MKWWEKMPLRIIEITNPFDIKNFSLKEQIKIIKELEGNVVHFHCMELTKKEGDSGLDDFGFYFETRHSKKKNPDILKPFIKIAHKNNIKVIVYFNVHWYKKEFAKRTGWGQIREDGSLIDNVYSTGSSLCINSQYRNWIFEIIEDLCKYEIDGIFYDGPIFFSNTCYCESCKKLFKEKYGEDIPKKRDFESHLWKKLIEFQVESIGRFLKDTDKIIKSKSSEILFYMNGNANWPFWPTGRNNREIIKYTDILGAEGGFIYNDLNLTPIYKPGITAKLLSSQSDGKPIVVFDCAGHKHWSWYLLPDKEVKILMYETIANGANVWMAIFPEDVKEKSVIKGISEINKKIKKNENIFVNTKSLSNVALLYPMVSSNIYKGSTVPLTDFTKEIKREIIGNIYEEFNGFYEILARSKVQFDVIDEENLKNLSKYEILVLPNVSCLSKENIDLIKKYVKDGGTLISTFETSLYDENGKKLKNFALSEIFGVDFKGEIFGPNNWDYIFPISDSQFIKGISKKYLPCSEYGIKTKNKNGNVFVYFYEKLKGCYDGVPSISNIPFAVFNKYGKGKSIYIGGTFGATYYKFRFPEYKVLIKNIVEKLSKKLIDVEQEWVEVILREKENEIFIHLINLTTGLKRPITYIKEIENLKIDIFFKFKSAKTIFSKEKIKIEKNKNYSSLILPVLKEYEIVYLKK